MPTKTAFYKFGGGGTGSTVTLNYTLREYIASTTWTKPANLIGIEIFMCGAGGGGASGAVRPAGFIARGGSGGGGGNLMWAYILAADLNITEPIVIAGGGAGGASVSNFDTDGTSGSSAGSTSFGVDGIQVKYRVNGGIGGSTTAGGSGAGASTNYPIYYPHQNQGPTGGLSSTTGSGGAGINGQSVFQAMVYPNAAAGGGVRSTEAASTGGVGSTVLNASMVGVGGAAAGAIGGAGGNGVSNSADFLKAGPLMIEVGLTGTYCIGSTGGGGGSGLVQNGGNAGLSGSFGTGGSGGGATRNGYTSGAGAAGTGAFIKVLEVTYTIS
jgi:hypothetical protein